MREIASAWTRDLLWTDVQVKKLARERDRRVGVNKLGVVWIVVVEVQTSLELGLAEEGGWSCDSESMNSECVVVLGTVSSIVGRSSTWKYPCDANDWKRPLIAEPREGQRASAREPLRDRWELSRWEPCLPLMSAAEFSAFKRAARSEREAVPIRLAVMTVLDGLGTEVLLAPLWGLTLVPRTCLVGWEAAAMRRSSKPKLSASERDRLSLGLSLGLTLGLVLGCVVGFAKG